MAFTEFKIKDNEPERVYDRCFRLRHHTNQINVDRISSYAGLAGAAASGVVGGSVAAGFFLGVAGGTISAGIMNTVNATEKKKPKKKEGEEAK